VERSLGSFVSSRRYALLLLAGAAGVAFNVAWVRFQFFGDVATGAFSDLIGVPASFAATIGCLVAARGAEARTRRAWRLFAAGMASWCIGETIWTYYELVLHQEVPFPSFADVGFLLLVPLAVAGMLTLPTAPRSAATRVRAILDGLIVGGSVMFIGWTFVLEDTIKAGEGTILSQVIGFAYPLGDLVIIACVLYVFGRARSHERRGLALICAGLLSLACADSGFTYMTLHNMYSSGNLVDPMWNLGFVLIALGAVRRPAFSASETDERRVGPIAIIAPYGPFMLATAVAVWVQITRGALTGIEFFNAIGVIACLTSRQLLALFDNCRLNRDLESRVAARTAELHKTLEQLEASRRLQDEFVANASHELLTPLTVIMASLEMITEDNTAENVSASVVMAERASHRMKRLVEDVLLASGVMDRVDCQREPFDLDAELRAAARVLAMSRKQLHMLCDAGLSAIGDGDRFRLVVGHLLSNADKFSAPESTITVKAVARPDGVHVIVSDEGPGIPESERDAVFTRFYQIDGSATRSHGGMGLGLYLARQLTESMGGTLVLDESDSGASFHLTLTTAATDAGHDDIAHRASA
jgi:signal transduction histidine kinase